MTTFDERARDWDADPARVERARAVAERIGAMVPLDRTMTALEYGCGTGLLGFALQPHLGHITLADSSEGMLAVLREKIAASGAANVRATKLDLTTDPRPSERYDLVVSLMTLHHVPDTRRILEDFHALLKPGGYLAVADLDREDGSFHGRDFGGHNGFDRDVLAADAARAGFPAVRFVTAFEITKTVKDRPRVFPVFLMVAQRP
ncbi:MAG TPA: class I SAM-dependent methyltransferase [Thermodesulfobacteriota bacterium]